MKDTILEPQVRDYTLEEKKIAMEIMDTIAGYHIDLDPETKGAIRDCPYDNSRSLMNAITGKMLTIIDSVVEDKERREAIKSLVRQMLQEEKKGMIDFLYKEYKN